MSLFDRSCWTIPALLLASVAAGCGGAPIRVTPISATVTAPEGALYFLPRQHLDVKIVLRFTAGVKPTCAKAAGDCQFQLTDVTVQSPEITGRAAPDPTAGFLIQTQGTFVTKTEFSATWNELGELTSATGSQTSSAPEWVATGIETIARIAKVIATAGAGETATLQSLSGRQATLIAALKALDNELAAVVAPAASPAPQPPTPTPAPAATGGSSKSGTPAPPPRPAATQTPAPPPTGDRLARIEKIQALREAVQKELDKVSRDLTRTIEVPIVCSFDPDFDRTSFGISQAARECPTYGRLVATLKSEQIDTSLIEPRLPDLKVTIVPEEGGDFGQAPQRPTESISGFYYRIPRRVRVDVTRKEGTTDAVIARMHMALPQLGRLGRVTVDEADMRPDKRLLVELHPGTGSLKHLEVTMTPLSVDKAKLVADAAIGAATTARDQDLLRLEEETRRLEAKKRYLDAVRALEPDPDVRRMPASPTVDPRDLRDTRPTSSDPGR